jgi:hypothetical protein
VGSRGGLLLWDEEGGAREDGGRVMKCPSPLLALAAYV